MAGRLKPGAGPLCAALVAAAVPLLAACGGSSGTPSAANSSVARTASTPAARAAIAREAAATESAKTHRDTVTQGVIDHRPLHGTGGGEINDDNPGNADVGSNPAAGENDPCELVSRAQAEAVLGRAIAPPQEAPLGPTCIYQPLGAKSFVTVAFAGIDLAQVRDEVHHLTRVNVDGHTGYCGVYGQPTTFVPVASGKLLSVTAPCGIGRLFAARALLRLRV